VLSVNLVRLIIAVTATESCSKACSLNSAARGAGAFLGSIGGGRLPGTFAFIVGQTLEDPGLYRRGLWVGAAISLVALVPVGLSRHAQSPSSEAQTRASGVFVWLPIALVLAHALVGHAGWAIS
jgi:hypothetical protein